jgi:hypothetical protein
MFCQSRLCHTVACFLASEVPAVLGQNVGRDNTFPVWLGVPLDVGGILGVAVLLQVGRGSTPVTWERWPCGTWGSSRWCWMLAGEYDIIAYDCAIGIHAGET